MRLQGRKPLPNPATRRRSPNGMRLIIRRAHSHRRLRSTELVVNPGARWYPQEDRADQRAEWVDCQRPCGLADNSLPRQVATVTAVRRIRGIRHALDNGRDSCRTDRPPGLASYLKHFEHRGGIIVCERRKFIYMKAPRTGGNVHPPQDSGTCHRRDHPSQRPPTGVCHVDRSTLSAGARGVLHLLLCAESLGPIRLDRMLL